MTDSSDLGEANAESTRPDIRGLCASWLAAATADGGIAIGGESERFRLRANAVHFHELDYTELRQAAVGLTEILLLPGLNTIIDFDHQLLWSWAAEVLLGSSGPWATDLDREIRELAETTMRAALANVRAPTSEAFDRARQASSLMEPNETAFLRKAHTALPYLAFPLLEAVSRRACPTYVDLTGRVLAPFARGSTGRYEPGGRCSSLADLLRLLVTNVAGPELRSDLLDLLAHIERLQPSGDSKDAYAVLFEWRNSSLHGEASLSTIGGTVLTLALMIALDTVREDYESHREQAFGRAVCEVGAYQVTGRWSPSPWSYYPPYP